MYRRPSMKTWSRRFTCGSVLLSVILFMYIHPLSPTRPRLLKHELYNLQSCEQAHYTSLGFPDCSLADKVKTFINDKLASTEGMQMHATMLLKAISSPPSVPCPRYTQVLCQLLTSCCQSIERYCSFCANEHKAQAPQHVRPLEPLRHGGTLAHLSCTTSSRRLY